MALNFIYHIIDPLLHLFISNVIVHVMWNIFHLFLPSSNSLNLSLSIPVMTHKNVH